MADHSDNSNPKVQPLRPGTPGMKPKFTPPGDKAQAASDQAQGAVNSSGSAQPSGEDLARRFEKQDSGTAAGARPPSGPAYVAAGAPAAPSRTIYDFDVGPRPDGAPANEIGAGGPCNYIFTVGRPGSGKSTLQRHILRYLMTHGDYSVEPDVEFEEENQAFQELRFEWERQWQTGAFPKANPIARPTEFRYQVVREGYKPMPFGFVEISGEDFETLIREPRPQLLPSIDEFLNNPNVRNLAFLFVCQGNNMSKH